jgi:hypothetical protein
MTFNRAQGQTVGARLGVYLPTPVFSHGQLYSAFGRGKNAKNVRALVDNYTKKQARVKCRDNVARCFVLNLVDPYFLGHAVRSEVTHPATTQRHTVRDEDCDWDVHIRPHKDVVERAFPDATWPSVSGIADDAEADFEAWLEGKGTNPHDVLEPADVTELPVPVDFLGAAVDDDDGPDAEYAVWLANAGDHQRDSITPSGVLVPPAPVEFVSDVEDEMPVLDAHLSTEAVPEAPASWRRAAKRGDEAIEVAPAVAAAPEPSTRDLPSAAVPLPIPATSTGRTMWDLLRGDT